MDFLLQYAQRCSCWPCIDVRCARGHQGGGRAQGAPKQQLALPLLILLGQQLRVIALQTESTHLKLVAELYDKAEQTLLQVPHLTCRDAHVVSVPHHDSTPQHVVLPCPEVAELYKVRVIYA